MNKTISNVPTRRPTLIDIARDCGLSRATVARALSGKGYVDPDRKRLIQQTAVRMGYRTSTIARALRTQRSSSIGVLIADITNPIFPEIVKGVDEVVTAGDHTIFLCNTDEDPQKQLAIIRSLLDRQVDGLVLISQTLSAESLSLLQGGPPCVFVNRRPDSSSEDYVGPNNEMGIRQLLDHLCALGHTRIGYIAGPLQSSTARERKLRFEIEMANRKLELPPELFFLGSYQAESGRAAAMRFMALTPMPTAIIGANDLVALGAIGALQENGIRVPEDISVTGFDDVFQTLFAGQYPLKAQGLTTVDQPKRELGRAAGRAILARINAPEAALSLIVLPTTLNMRDTTGPARTTV